MSEDKLSIPKNTQITISNTKQYNTLELPPKSGVHFQDYGIQMFNNDAFHTKVITTDSLDHLIANDPSLIYTKRALDNNNALFDHDVEQSSNISDWFCKCLGFCVPEPTSY